MFCFVRLFSRSLLVCISTICSLIFCRSRALLNSRSFTSRSWPPRSSDIAFKSPRFATTKPSHFFCFPSRHSTVTSVLFKLAFRLPILSNISVSVLLTSLSSWSLAQETSLLAFSDASLTFKRVSSRSAFSFNLAFSNSDASFECCSVCCSNFNLTSSVEVL